MMYSFRSCKYMPFSVASCMPCTDIHVGMPVVMLIVSVFSFMSSISLTLFSLRVCLGG